MSCFGNFSTFTNDLPWIIQQDASIYSQFVNLSSGVIRTAIPNMDRETQDEFLVVIQAKDMGGHVGGLSGSTTVTVTLTDVNDNPPKFPQSKNNSFMLLKAFFGVITDT